MKFAILYNTDSYPAVHGSAEPYYNQILEQVELEEELGFDAVWFGEHHYSGYSFGSPPVMAMAAAGRTKRIRLGTGISLVPLNNPIRPSMLPERLRPRVISGPVSGVFIWRPPFSYPTRSTSRNASASTGRRFGKTAMSRQTVRSPAYIRCIAANRTQKPGATVVSMR